MGGHGDDVVHGEVAHDAGLDLNLLRVGLPLHLVAGLQLLARHDAEAGEHADRGLAEVVVEDDGAARLAVEATTAGLLNPLLTIAVAVEADGFANLDIFTDHLNDGRNLRFTFFYQFVHFFLEFGKLFGYGCVQGNHGAGTVGLRTYGTEFKAVAAEGKWRCTVTVCIVNQQFRNLWNVEFHTVFAS